MASTMSVEALNLCANCQVRNAAICSALEGDALQELNALITHITFDPGQTIFFEGDEADHLFNLVSGSVRVSKALPDGRRQITGFLAPADFLGLSIAGVYAYTADAISTVKVCRFPRRGLQKLATHHPNLEHRLLQLASNELAEAQSHILLLGRKTSAEKLASFLLSVLEKRTKSNQDPSTIDLPMTRQDVGDYLGLTIETVSRTFTKFRKENLIELPSNHSVHVLNKERLETIAGGY